MYRGIRSPWRHPSTPDDITTINYTLTWPHLENPSNTTFAGSSQIDICRCPRSDLPPQTEDEPGHIYTRFKCIGPEVGFSSPEDDLWVLQAPHGPLNMLRPATNEERRRRQEVYDGAEATVYSDRNFLFLTGPCPRGRYQAYATLQFLRSLTSSAREQVSEFTLLLQPFEEDFSADASRQSYEELVEYVMQNLPRFRKLHLEIWDDEMKLVGVANVFCVLLNKEHIKIVVGCRRWKGANEEYTTANKFLDVLSGVFDRSECSSTSEGLVKRRVQEIDRINQSDETNDR